MMALLYSSLPINHGSVTESQNLQHDDPEIEAGNWKLSFFFLLKYLLLCFSYCSMSRVFLKKKKKTSLLHHFENEKLKTNNIFFRSSAADEKVEVMAF